MAEKTIEIENLQQEVARLNAENESLKNKLEQSEKKSVFATLNAINCNEHTEQKNGLTYLSWSWAWAEVKKAYPTAFYTIYENANGLNYHTDGNTAWVKTGVTIEGIEHIEYLPVMDFKNKAIPVANLTSFDVNKAIQRSLTKACARHGLGLYIYAGEDLPEDEKKAIVNEIETAKYAINNAPTSAEIKRLWQNDFKHLNYNKELLDLVLSRGKMLAQQEKQQQNQ